MSYEDMAGGKGLLASYKVTMEGTETVDGAPCYRIAMEARRRDVPYYRQTMWIDQELFIFRKVNKFSRSGTLLKELQVLQISRVAGHNVATRMVLKDILKRNSSTEFVLDKLEIDVPLPKDTFSLRGLTW